MLPSNLRSVGIRRLGVVALLVAALFAQRPAHVSALHGADIAAAGPFKPPITTYNAIDLGTLGGGAFSYAHAINDSGVVVGRSIRGTEQLHQPFIWQNGVMTGLSVLPGASWGEANDINESGVVVGNSRTPSDFAYATVWVGGVPTELPRPPNRAARAYGINTAGDVVGEADVVPFARAALWRAGALIDLGSLPNGLGPQLFSGARAINDVGQIVGYSYVTMPNGSQAQHAVLWQDGTIIDLTPTAANASALAINDSGLVVGYVERNQAFYWQNGVLTVIGASVCPPCALGSTAFDVNQAGVIALEAATLAPVKTAHLLFNGELTTLPGTSWAAATAVNNVGQVAGYFGNGHAILWNPDPVTTSLAPHPVSGSFGGHASLSATLTVSGGVAISRQTVTFSLFGARVGDAITDANGVATLGPVSLGQAAATYPGALQASFDGSGQYLASSGDADVSIAQATPIVTWSAPAAITHGTALGATQLNASADVPGTFEYSPAAGNVLDVGSSQLFVTFTPADTANYTTASAGVSLTVTPSDLTGDVEGLIAMILAANANPGPDTITLSPNATYTLTTAYDATNGLPSITDALSIVGNGATITRSAAPGTPSFRIMTVNLPTQSAVATFSNITISNGRGAGDFQGGGIRLARGTLNLDDARVSGNAAAWGGGLYATSNTRLNLTRTVVTGNASDEPTQGGSGGGIYNYQGAVTLADSTISVNTARNSGGIFNYQGPLTIAGSTISGNATSPNGTGGGLTAYESTVTITGSTIIGNSAHDGGGIFNYGTLSIDRSTISGNTAAIKGGGIYGYTGGTLTVTNSTISGNNAHSVSAPTSGYGGGIFNWSGSTATIANSTIYGNFTNFGGGGLYNNGAMTVLNVTVGNNESTQYGSGLLNDTGGTATVGNTVLAGNYLQRNCAFGGPITSAGHNLSDGGSCAGVFTQISDDNNIAAGLDPLGLRNNGGPTDTVALVAGSPAINTGSDTLCAAAPIGGHDQRGVTRPDGPHCDKGAFEAPSPDAAPPTINCALPDGLWHRLDVVITCTASDPSGLQNPDDASFTLSTSVPLGIEATNALTDSRSVCDSLGHCATAGPIAGNKIDKRPPSIAITSPAAQVYRLGQIVTGSYHCDDAGSGVSSCGGSLPSGALVPTGAVGTFTFIVDALDAAGNTASSSSSYTVSAGIPHDGVWRELNSMQASRYGLVASSIDGLVYAIGGAYQNIDFHSVGTVSVTTVEAYDPVTGLWTTKTPLPVSRVYPNGAGVIGGRIYVPGGAGCDAPACRESDTLLIFDPANGPSGSWTAGPPMPIRILGGSSGVIGNQLYVLAGWSVGAPRNYLLRFDTLSSTWTQLTDSPRGHTFGASAVVGGKLYATGGEISRNALDIYDPATNSWTSKTMPLGYQHHGAVAIDGKLYLAGGSQFINGQAVSFNVVMAYDPQSDAWTVAAPVAAAGGPYAGRAGDAIAFSGTATGPLPALPTPLNLPAATSIGSALFIMGGGTMTNNSPLPTLLAVSPPGQLAPLAYDWNFGDGSHATGESPSHVYAAPGTYTVTLTVSTPDGRTGTATVAATIRGPQAIAFTTTPPSPALAGGTYVVAATGGGSGNPVTFSSLTSATCSLNGNIVSFTGVGTCTIAADQAAGGVYDAAPQVAQTVIVTAPPPPIPATDLQRWKVSNGFYTLSVFGDGTLLAAGGTGGGTMNSRTGAALGGAPGVLRAAIRLSTGDQDYSVGGYQGRPAFRQDGSFVRDLMAYLGCCNIWWYPMALDPTRDQAYVLANNELFGANMSTGALSVHLDKGAGDFVGMISLADSDTLYTAGQGGNVTRLHPVNGRQWTANIDAQRLQPGAVAADGSFVVASGTPHLEGAPQPGRLARVRPDGTVAWNNAVNAVTPPVIGGNNLVFVGIQAAPVNVSGPGAIAAYDLTTGVLVWRTNVVGLPNDLLVGDDGAVYAGTGQSPTGRVYALGQTDGVVRRTVSDIAGAWEIVLRGGLLIATGDAITALPVDAVNYDPTSPWPVRFHDNQRTGNRQAPLLTAPRDAIAQSITFASTPPSPAIFGGTYIVSATGGGSGNPVTFSSLMPATCGVSGNVVSFVGIGDCTIAADQAGSSDYDAAIRVTQSFTTVPAAQAITITSTPPSPALFGASYALIASGGRSGNPVVFSSLTPSICTVSGNTVSLVGISTCTIAANQAGGNGYDAAPQVAQTFAVTVRWQVSLGSQHACALRPDGTLVCWGYNANGQATVPAGLTSVVQVSAGGFHTCALRSNGAVVCWGRNTNGQSTVPAGLSGVRQISAGNAHTCAVRDDGTVTCWGSNSNGQSSVPVGFGSAVQVSAGVSHTCAVKTDGTVRCWGNNGAGESTVPAGLTTATQVTTGGSHSCAVRADGTVVCWGGNGNGQTSVPPGLGTIVQVVAGSGHTCALITDGAVVCWGLDANRQSSIPADLGPVTQLSAAGVGTCAIVSNTTADCWGGAPFVPASLNPIQRLVFYSTPASPALEGTTYAVAAFGGGSGNPIMFSSQTAEVCSVSGNSVTLIAGGTCVIAANQAAGNGYNAAAEVTQAVTVTPLARIARIDLTPTSVYGGAENATATVTLTSPAVGTQIQRRVVLSSSEAGAATVPANVTVPLGATTASFNITTLVVANTTLPRIGGTLNSSGTNATLTVNPLPRVTSLTLSPGTVVGGAQDATGTVTLNAPAIGTAAQRRVSLSSDNTAAATAPANVTVPIGATSATFVVQSSVVTADATSRITAALNGGSAVEMVRVTPLPGAQLVVLNPDSVIGGSTNAVGTVTLSAPAIGSTTQRRVFLVSDTTSAATVPGSIVVPVGATSATFDVTTKYVTANANVRITATMNGIAAPAARFTVKAQGINNISINPWSVPSGTTTATGLINLNGPAAGTAAERKVTLVSDNPAIASVPASVVAAVGAESVAFVVTLQPVTVTTTVNISATMNGRTFGATITVVAPPSSVPPRVP